MAQFWVDGMHDALFTDAISPFTENPIVEALWEWAQEYQDEGPENLISWSLETCNCAYCHAPGGLIYNNEIAAKVIDWWDAIDDALDRYHDATGERYDPETVGQLVWFAVEWFAGEMANYLRSHSDWSDWEAQGNDPEFDSFVQRFHDEIAPLVIEQYGENDEPAMNEAFCNWVDALNRDGEISDYFAENVTLDQ